MEKVLKAIRWYMVIGISLFMIYRIVFAGGGGR